MPSDARPWLTVAEQAPRQWSPQRAARPDVTAQPLNLIGTGSLGFATGDPFTATLIGFRGLQNVRSHQYALLQLPDGTVRGWPVQSFAAADQAHLAELEAKAHAVAVASQIMTTPDQPERTVEYIDYDPVADDAYFNLYETEHFAFYIGYDPTSEGEMAFSAAFLDEMMNMFEQVWAFFEDDLHYPMPHEELGWHKINVYLLHTGLPKHSDNGWANAARQMVLSPLAMLEGSSVIPHEFAHVVQLYSNGFQDNPSVGYFWETHASWATHQMIPAFDAELMTYMSQLQHPINWAGFRYGSWMLLQHLAEDSRFGSDFVRDLWIEGTLDEDSGAALEDPMQVIARLGVQRGLFDADGLGDLIGEMAARTVTFDYIYQQTYLDLAEQKLAEPWLTRRGVPLKAAGDGSYRPLDKYIPGQWGMNHVRLEPTSQDIAVYLSALDKDVSWRMTLVAYDENGNAAYSAVSADGTVRLTVNDWPYVMLALAAIPAEHEPLPFETDIADVRRYPYALRFDGAQPWRG